MNAIDRVLGEIIRREGGYVNHPADRGGPTKYGITAQTLGDWRKLWRAATAEEVQQLTEAEARDIYRKRYITDPGLDQVSHPALLHLLVDSAVHSGPKRAVRWLQGALGVKQDGFMSAETVMALAGADQGAIYGKVLGQRMRHLGRLITSDPKQAAFAAGWMNRLAEFVEEQKWEWS